MFQDMARLLKYSYGADTKLTCGGLTNTEIPVHSSVLAARSNVLAEMILPLNKFDERENSKTDTAEDKISDTREPQDENVINTQKERSNVRARRYSAPVLQNVRINLF